jgi:hypothetical protein
LLPAPFALYADDDALNYTHDTNFTSPLNKYPVVDDISQLFDDDSVTNVTTLMIPAEQEQPASWPIVVFGIFIAVAVLLVAVTVYKNYRKRSTYTEVPTTSLIV